MSKYEIGDIVYVSKYDNKDVENHLFVIVGDDEQLVPAEFFGLIVSSHIEKSKDVSPFKYNEPLTKNNNNGLNANSIVKCDQVYNIPTKNIQFKIGQVDADDFIRFMNSLENYIKENTKEKQNA